MIKKTSSNQPCGRDSEYIYYWCVSKVLQYKKVNKRLNDPISLNIVVGLMVSEKIFYNHDHESMGANEHLGVANSDPRGMVDMVYVEYFSNATY